LRVTLGFALAALLVAPARSDSDFQTWLAALRAEAEAQGISAETLDRALSGVEPIERVIELDRRQPEFTQTFWHYLDQRISEQRIERGHAMLAEHQALFQEVGERYGVQPRFLAAFWGLESNYGSYTGDHRVIDALVTLAYDPRRGDFFRTQLIDALKIIDEGHIAPETMMGSWAGAMGHVQFIPSTFRNYAVDQDGDGRRDIWQSLPDALGSAANFLTEIGWDATKTWGREVRLPAGFDWELAGLERRKMLAEWQALGVRKIDGRSLPAVDLEASLVAPGGHKGPAFLVYQNFRVILNWNRSVTYAIAVGHLADRLAGAGPLETERPAGERPLSRVEVEELQERLLAEGFDPGTPDGIVGGQTRAALRAYQRRAGLPPDGFPSVEVLQKLRTSEGG
jgi:membrane-bound lytic murein transglycosylase B